jgi:uncharacterized membrane protein HdeD (DUF308 family)
VIPIIVRPADWQWAPLDRLQALPKDARPITTWLNRDEAWLDVARGIRKAVEELSVERQERAAAEERYRKAVDEAWADKKLSDADAEQLDTLAGELSMSTDAAAEIERNVMDGTKEAILERQEQVAREGKRKERLDELYAGARKSYQDRQWQAVIDVFEQIHTEDPTYPDPEELLTSTREALDAQESERRVAALYAEGQRHMDAGEWQQALECFEEVKRLKPGYRDTEESLERIRQLRSRGRIEQAGAREQLRQQTEGRPTDQAEQAQHGDFAERQSLPMQPVETGHWWALALRGAIAILFGMAALPSPGITIEALIFLFGAYALVDGVFAIVGAFGGTRGGTPRWLLFVDGIAGILAGMIAFFWPGLTAVALLYLIVVWAVITGIFEIAMAIRLQNGEIRGEWAMIVGGALSVLLGVILYEVEPVAGLLSLLWLIGIYAVAFGIMLLITAFRVRRRGEVETASS